MQLLGQRMEAPNEASASSFPSSLTQNCKTALYQIGSWAQAGEALGRAGEEAAKPIGVFQSPDIELNIKKKSDEDK